MHCVTSEQATFLILLQWDLQISNNDTFIAAVKISKYQQSDGKVALIAFWRSAVNSGDQSEILGF
jgi:hypothetical protein